MEAGSMRSLGLLPMAKSTGDLPHRVTCIYSSLLLPYASTEQVWSATEWSRPDFWRLYPRVKRQKFLEESYTHLSSIWPRSVWSCRWSLHIMHSVECLHIMRMMESHICTNRLWIHLESVHPFMKFGNDFWCRGTLTWIYIYIYICRQMWCRSIKDNQKSKVFVSNFCRSMDREDKISKSFSS